jgi:hypothetical protein
LVTEAREGPPIGPAGEAVHHLRYVIYRLAEVAVRMKLFAAILARIGRLAPATTQREAAPTRQMVRRL